MTRRRLERIATAAFSSIAVAACIYVQAAYAADPPSSGQSSSLSTDATDPDDGMPMPDREREFVTILREEEKRYESARNGPQKSDVRMALEVRVADFMDVSQEAADWLGIIRETHSTPEGDLWVVIEIAPGITISTWNNRFADRDDLTLIRNFSPLHYALGQLKVDQPVMFNATMIMYDISSDEDMVQRPHIIARFRSVKPVVFQTVPEAAAAPAAAPAAKP